MGHGSQPRTLRKNGVPGVLAQTWGGVHDVVARFISFIDRFMQWVIKYGMELAALLGGGAIVAKRGPGVVVGAG
jgi:hypothetical protein